MEHGSGYLCSSPMSLTGCPLGAADRWGAVVKVLVLVSDLS